MKLNSFGNASLSLADVTIGAIRHIPSSAPIWSPIATIRPVNVSPYEIVGDTPDTASLLILYPSVVLRE